MSTQNRVCCLYRVSTDKQVDYDNNHEADIPMQRKACHKFAEQMGWEIVHEEQEDGVSGHKVRAENRDKIQAIKELALKGKFDILLVFMFDRIGRIADETPFVVEWFVKNGIQVWSTQEGEQRFDNHIDKLLNYIRFWQADGESEKTSIRTKTSLGQMVEAGHYKGGVAPIGYDLVKSGRFNKKKHELYDLKINKEQAAMVKIVFDKYTNEGYGVQKIADYLNDNGFLNPTGNRWSHNTIRNILKNTTYIGILHSGESVSPCLEELRIISDEQFNRASDIREQRAQAKRDLPRVPINMRGTALLSGNVFCGHCGSRLNLTRSGKNYTLADGSAIKRNRIRYACYGKTRKLTKCDGQSGYTQTKLDSIVDELVKKIFEKMKGVSKNKVIKSRYQKELNERKTVLTKLRSEYARETSKLEKLKGEIIKILDGESNMSREVLTDLVNETNAKVKDLRAKCEAAEKAVEAEHELMKDLGDRFDEIMGWAELYDTATIEAKKTIANSMIKRIDVFRGYELKVDFSFDITQFLGGITENPVQTPETA